MNGVCQGKRQRDYGNRGTISTLLQPIDCFDTPFHGRGADGSTFNTPRDRITVYIIIFIFNSQLYLQVVLSLSLTVPDVVGNTNIITASSPHVYNIGKQVGTTID